MWSFENDLEFQPELDWIQKFVKEEVEPLDYVLGSQWNIHSSDFKRLVRPLQTKVKGVAAPFHLTPEGLTAPWLRFLTRGCSSTMVAQLRVCLRALGVAAPKLAQKAP